MEKLLKTVLTAFLSITRVSLLGNFCLVQAQTTEKIITPQRIAGSNRYATADSLFEKFTSADTVIIASGDNFPDALCAAPLAKKYNAPILLSTSIGLSHATLAEITRLKATKAIIIGGTGVVTAVVDNQLTSAGVIPTRLAGKDRYETSLLVAKQLMNPTAIVVTSGEDFPDALCISAIAAQLDMPIILSSKNDLSLEAENYIKNSGATKQYIIGGTGALTENIDRVVANPIRLEGKDRYDTDIKVFDEFSSVLNFDTIYLATGENFADALSGSVLAGKNSNPLLLVGKDLTSEKLFFNKNSSAINNITILGGIGVVSEDTVSSLIYSTKIAMFEDKSLEHIVRFNLNKPDGDIFKSDLLSITSIEAKDRGITNLSGIENLTNLTDLDLTYNWITNIDVLKGLTNLKNLNVDLNFSSVSNLDALKELTNLNTLTLSSSKITNIDALRNLSNLTSLKLNSIKIDNLSALKGLTNLTTLDLSVSKINNIDDLQGLSSLTSLDLMGVKINNIDALKGLTNLTTLDLGSTEINNLEGLKGLAKLTSLALGGNEISNIDALSGLTNLNYLDLEWNQISNIEALKGLTNLKALVLCSNQISNIDALKDLTKLTYLPLSDNKVTDYSPIDSYRKNLQPNFPTP